MPTLAELHKRRIELEKLSDYHRVLLGDSIQQSAASLRIVEGLGLLATSPLMTKLTASGLLSQAIPAALEKLLPSLKGFWRTCGGGMRLLSFLAKTLLLLFSFLKFILHTANSVFFAFSKKRKTAPLKK